jgi:hypothetical protein
MALRDFIKPKAKREELKTYRELELRRELKSKRLRRRVEGSGKRRVLGDGSVTRPHLIVEEQRYREVRRAMQLALLAQARASGLNLPIDTLLEQLSPRIESLAYAQLAGENDYAAAHHLPVEALGRSLTTQERLHFAASRAAGGTVLQPNRLASTALDNALHAIEKRQSHNPARYQTIWAQLVGPDAAQQSQLDRVDPRTQTAYFRCYNSVLSADLQRRPGFALKLGRALGVPVTRLRAQF